MIQADIKYKCMMGHNGQDYMMISEVSYVKFNPELVSEIVYMEDSDFTVNAEIADKILSKIFGARRVLTEVYIAAPKEEYEEQEYKYFYLNKCTKIIMSNKRVYYALP